MIVFIALLFVVCCLRVWAEYRDGIRNAGAVVTALVMAFLFLCAIPAFSQGAFFNSNAWTASRQVAPGQSAPILTLPYAKVSICFTTTAIPLACTTSAPVYSDAGLTQLITQPFTADAQGNFGFFAAPGQYIATITTTSGQQQLFPLTIVGTGPSGPAGPPGGSLSYPGVVSDGANGLTVAGSIKVASGFNLVAGGDSRLAGAFLYPGQDLLTQISLQPQFTGHATVHNGAVNGALCADMTSVYSTNVRPYRPGGGVTTSYLFIIDGYNDYVFGQQNITSISRTSNVVTVNLANGVPAVGQSIVVSGVGDASFNGTFTALSVSGPSFTYAQTASNATSSGGQAQVGLVASQIETCYQAYLNQAVADGFTPVLLTSYYSAATTDAQDLIRQQENDWIRSQPFLIIDVDRFFPPAAQNIWRLGGASGPPFYSITGYSISSNTISGTTTGTIPNGTLIYLSNFPFTSGLLNNQFFTVTSSGTGTFTATSPSFVAPNVSSSDTGIAETIIPTPDGTHLGPSGIILLAKAVNATWAAAKTGTSVPVAVDRDYFNPLSGAMRLSSCLILGHSSSICPFAGIVLSATPTTGAAFFGGDGTSFLARTAGTGYTLGFGTEGGGLQVTGATKGLAWVGGSIAACAASLACVPDNLGNLYSATSTTGGGLSLGTDLGWTLSRSGANTIWHTPGSVALDHPFASSAFFVGATAGVSCSGTPTSSFASVNGIVTHC